MLGNFVGLISGWKPEKPRLEVIEGVAITALSDPLLHPGARAQHPVHLRLEDLPADHHDPRRALELGAGTSIVYHSFLPALSIVIVVFGWWVISVKAQTLRRPEGGGFRRLCPAQGPEPTRASSLRYVLPNAILPQITFLALQLGLMFNGSIITEILFDYPGLGLADLPAVLQGDYNLLMGTISLSVIAVATATMMIDLIYPLLDPRIRHR